MPLSDIHTKMYVAENHWLFLENFFTPPDLSIILSLFGIGVWFWFFFLPLYVVVVVVVLQQ